MKGTKKILAVLAAGIIMMPALAQARHAEDKGAAIVRTDRTAAYQQVKGASDTKILDRIKNILQSRDGKQTQDEQNPQGLARWDMDSRDEGGTLIFSDSPEYVDQNGILYQDSVKGAGVFQPGKESENRPAARDVPPAAGEHEYDHSAARRTDLWCL